MPDSPTLHSRWRQLLKIEIALIVCSCMALSSSTYLPISANLYRLGILWKQNHIKIFCSKIWAEIIFGWPTWKVKLKTRWAITRSWEPLVFKLYRGWTVFIVYLHLYERWDRLLLSLHIHRSLFGHYKN